MREYCLKIREIGSDGNIVCEGENNGFTTLELIALLDMKKLDLMRQLNDSEKGG